MKTEKRRGFVFYTQDYFGATDVRLMEPAMRLVWNEMFFLMDQSPRRGVLLKQNETPYTHAELATLINCPVSLVEQTATYVLKEGIASKDRRSGTLANRRMLREEAKHKINQNNGKKGGNPALFSEKKTTIAPLVGNTKDKQLDGSVNRNTTQPDKARARVPDPEPDPEPDCIPHSPTVPITEKSPVLPVSPPAEKRGGRKRDRAADHFQARHLERTGAPYRFRREDFVHLTALRKDYGIASDADPPGWADAVTNYLVSPLGKYTLADLCVRYAVFRNSPTDGFNHQTRGNGNGQESKSQARARRIIEATRRDNQELLGEDSDRDRPGNGTGTNRNLPRSLSRSE